MQQFKRIVSCEELRTGASSSRLHRKESKDPRNKALNFKPREVFLTDTQTDQTKSSNECQTAEVTRLEYSVKRLERENKDLKETILKLKASQFYGINEEKLKKLIKQNENLQQEVKLMKKQLDKTLIEKDFLERNNKILKLKYEESTKETNKPFIQSRLKTQFHQFHDYELIDDIEDFLKENKPVQKQKRSVSGSSEKGKALKKKLVSSRTEQKGTIDSKRLKENNSKVGNDNYFIFSKGSKKGHHQ